MRISAIVEPEVVETWRGCCERNCINTSKVLAKLMADYLKETHEFVEPISGLGVGVVYN